MKLLPVALRQYAESDHMMADRLRKVVRKACQTGGDKFVTNSRTEISRLDETTVSTSGP